VCVCVCECEAVRPYKMTIFLHIVYFFPNSNRDWYRKPTRKSIKLVSKQQLSKHLLTI
jgi:hypothetical protein